MTSNRKNIESDFRTLINNEEVESALEQFICLLSGLQILRPSMTCSNVHQPMLDSTLVKPVPDLHTEDKERV